MRKKNSKSYAAFYLVLLAILTLLPALIAFLIGKPMEISGRFKFFVYEHKDAVSNAFIFFILPCLFVLTAVLRRIKGKKTEALKGIALFFMAASASYFATRGIKEQGIRYFIYWFYQMCTPVLLYFYIDEIYRAVVPALKGAAAFTGRIFRAFAELSAEAFGNISASVQKAGKNRRYRKNAMIILAVVFSAALLFAAGKKAYDAFFVNAAVSPSGEARQDTLIKVKFSQPVEPVTPGEYGCLIFSPPISGTFSFENKDTVVFKPTSALPPATEFTATLKPNVFRAEGKTISSAKKTEFHTPYLKVMESRYFFNKDLLNKKDKELVVELNFNYPVESQDFSRLLSVKRIMKDNENQAGGDESDISFKVEKTNMPTKYYIKIFDIEKTYDYKVIVLKISEGLACKNCGTTMKYTFSKRINIGAKQRLQAQQVITWPMEGKTGIAVQFNMPVEAAGAEKKIRVWPNYGGEEVEVTASSEYTYLVLEGNFKNRGYYQIRIEDGIVSKSGEKLENSFEQSFYFEGIPAKVEFAEPGEILMPDGNLILPIKVMNAQHINVNIYKVFKNNLVYFLQNRHSMYGAGKLVFQENKVVENAVMNKESTEYISLGKMIKEPYKGVFVVNLGGGGYYYGYGGNNSKTVLCTDMGMLAKEQGKDLNVKVFSVKKFKPEAGVRVKIISSNNQVMKTETTDMYGMAKFEDYKSTDYNFTPFIVLAEKGEDFSYLNLNDSLLNTGRFDTSGVSGATEGITAFIGTDRGLYRPGDKARLSVIARNRNMSVPPAIFVRMKIYGPQGETIYDEKEKLKKNGVAVFEVPLSQSVLTGQYRADLMVNDSEHAGTAEFKVEEFIPDKLEVFVDADADEFTAGEPIKFTVRANQMFGPPAEGNRVEANIHFTGYNFTSKKFSEYIFNDPDRTYSRREERIGEETLDTDGEYTFKYSVPDDISPPSAIQAQVFANVFDDGGRPVSGYKEFRVYPYEKYIGIKTREKRRVYRLGEKIAFDLAAVSPDDSPRTALAVPVTVKKRVWFNINRYYWWRHNNYESVDYRQDVADTQEDIKSGKGSFVFEPKEPGEYYIFAGDAGAMRTGIIVNVTGSGTAGFDMEKSDKVMISMDKNKYSKGDVAEVTINAPFDGVLYLTVERDKVYKEMQADIKDGTAKVKIKMDPDFFPNAYISAIALREQDEKYVGLPVLAYGIQNMELDQEDKDLKPEIETAGKAMSSDGIKVKVRTNSGHGTAVMLFAVDEGILQIIRFLTPDPLAFFYSKRALEVKTYTTLSKILTDVKALKQAIGGDYGEPSRKHLNPVLAKVVESYAKFSGIMYTNIKGEVSYVFDAKDFNGKARIMAICADKDKFGSSEKQVNVTDAIVITPNLPRFLAPGDSFKSAVRVFNNTGTEGVFDINLKIKGPVKIEGDAAVKVTIGVESEAKLVFNCKALEDTGKAEFEYQAAGGGAVVAVKRELGVRPAQHEETVVIRGSLEPGKSMEQDVKLNYTSLLKNVRLNVSYSRMAEAAGALEYLIRYPYGCVEQTTSSTFPMVFFKDMGLDNSAISHAVANIDEYVASGIKRLQTFITPAGRLSYWPGGDYEVPQYLQLYVANFIIEARKRGFYVPNELYDKVITGAGLNRSDSVNLVLNRFDTGGWNEYYYGRREDTRIFQLYLRSLMGNPDRQFLEYLEKLLVVYYSGSKNDTGRLKDNGYTGVKLDSVKKRDITITENEAKNFVGDLGEAETYLLSLALSLADMRPAAGLLLSGEYSSKYTDREMWGWFNSYTKSLGMYLLACAEADQDLSPRVLKAENELVSKLQKNGSFGNTQETCWALMGLAAANKVGGKTGAIKAEIYADGKIIDTLSGMTGKGYSDVKNEWEKLAVKNTGKNRFYYCVNIGGIPKSKKGGDRVNGLRISRKYYDENGSETDIKSVKQGALIVTSVTVEPVGKPLNNVIIVDMLPAGFEVENPRIRSRGALNFEPVSDMDPGYQDIRDDRILIFTKEIENKSTFSYTVRAVTPGKYVVPNVFAEAMYDPEIFGEGFSGDYLTVKEK